MLGKLTDSQIDHVLNSQLIGRLACTGDDKIYIVPITYVYHKGYIYAHSKDGQKVEMMRSNPRVCFQVDAIENMTNWRSVILWGTFEELKGARQNQQGMKIMGDRLIPYTLSESVRPTQNFDSAPEVISKGLRTIAYRIKVSEKTGRFEKP